MFSLIELFVLSVLPYLYLIIECVLYRKNIFESQNLFKVGIIFTQINYYLCVTFKILKVLSCCFNPPAVLQKNIECSD